MTILNNSKQQEQSNTTIDHSKTKQFNRVRLAGAVLIIVTMVTSTSAVNSSNHDEMRSIRHHRTDEDQDPNEDIYVAQLHNEQPDYPQQPPPPPPPPACPNCLYDNEPIVIANRASRRRTNDNLRLEAIKRQILTKLGLRHKPNVTKAASMMPRKVVIETLFRAEDSVPAAGGAAPGLAGSTGYSDDSYDNGGGGGGGRVGGDDSEESGYETEDSDDFYGRTSEIISFPEQGYKVNGNRLLEFRVSPEAGQLGQEFRIRAATLWLKADIRYARAQHCRTTEIYVFKFKVALQDSVKLNSKDFSRLTDYPVALYLNETQPGWQKIDLTGIVRDWLTDTPRDKLRLFIDCSCCSSMWNIHLLNSNSNNNWMGGRYYSGGGPSRGDSAENRPFLVIHTDPTQTKRVRRRALDCGADSGNQCCKQRFYVSFRELGWEDWIIAPQGYYANYCRGDCSHNNPLMGGGGHHHHHHHHRTPDTYANYHTHVIEEIRKTHHLSGMQPCCAPLKFSSVSLIYFGPDSNIIKRDLPKMVVDECGCP